MSVAELARAALVLVRHCETTYNLEHRLNGDPAVSVPLSPAGREQCARLGRTLARVGFASCYVTRFGRTRESLELLLPDCPGGVRMVPELDDIGVGDFEGLHREEYRTWRRTHGVAEAPPGGESRLATVRRYAAGLRRLAAEAPRPALVVAHDQPIRYLENVLAGEDPVFGPVRAVPNAVPYAYDDDQLATGIERLERYPAEQR
jgi:broad specificity phosphatase PhoE